MDNIGTSILISHHYKFFFSTVIGLMDRRPVSAGCIHEAVAELADASETQIRWAGSTTVAGSNPARLTFHTHK